MMVNVFHAVLNMSITGAYIAAALIILRLAIKKLPKRYSYALWIILGIRLLCPFSFSSAASLFNLIKPETSENQMVYIPADIEYSPSPQITLPPVDNAVNDSMSSLEPNVGDSANPLQIVYAVCSLVWLAGVAAMVLYTVISYALVRRKVCGAMLLQDNIYICKDIDSPFVYGILKPRIYLPENIPATETEFILAHERAHIKRGDHIIKLIAMAALCIHWFNPLAWVSYRLMIRDMELSCDEIAVNGFDRDVRKDYAETLLNMSMRQNKIVLGGILAFGESSIKTRIKSVLSAKKPRVIVSVTAAVVVVTAAVCLLTNASSEMLRRKPVSAEIMQMTTIAYAERDEIQLIDGNAAVKLINKLKLEEIPAEEMGELPEYVTCYMLALYYDENKSEYDNISILSPVHYSDNVFRSSYDGGKLMTLETSDGETKIYSLSDKDYEKLCGFFTKPFEKFPGGRYFMDTDEGKWIDVIKDGENTRFELFIDGGRQDVWGAPDKYEACGMRALWQGDDGPNRCIEYNGNGQITAYVGPAPEFGFLGTYIRSTKLGDAAEGINGVTPVPSGYRANTVYFMREEAAASVSLPDGWIFKACNDSERTPYGFNAPLAEIVDENGGYKGIAAYNAFQEYDSVSEEDYYKAVYSDINWDNGNYTPVAKRGTEETAVTKVTMTDGGKITEYPAVLAYDRGKKIYIGIQFGENAVTDEQLRIIAESVDFFDMNTVQSTEENPFLYYDFGGESAPRKNAEDEKFRLFLEQTPADNANGKLDMYIEAGAIPDGSGGYKVHLDMGYYGGEKAEFDIYGGFYLSDAPDEKASPKLEKSSVSFSFGDIETFDLKVEKSKNSKNSTDKIYGYLTLTKLADDPADNISFTYTITEDSHYYYSNAASDTLETFARTYENYSEYYKNGAVSVYLDDMAVTRDKNGRFGAVSNLWIEYPNGDYYNVPLRFSRETESWYAESEEKKSSYGNAHGTLLPNEPFEELVKDSWKQFVKSDPPSGGFEFYPCKEIVAEVYAAPVVIDENKHASAGYVYVSENYHQWQGLDYGPDNPYGLPAWFWKGTGAPVRENDDEFYEQLKTCKKIIG